MEYEMRLDSEPFEKIKSGKKKIEVRLNDQKRKNILIGDTIIFYKRPDLRDSIKVKVIGRRECSTYSKMSKYYSSEEQKKYGFVVFKIELLKK